ncbi:MAG TPA: HD domain-containing protein [Thermoplasmatales archaeon]|nr:HD domain-containing protein [Thermoplasmatales archaeon]
MCDTLHLGEEESLFLRCASLLHDIGHGPFSHTLESILRNSLDVDHIDLTGKLIFGDYKIFHDFEEQFVESKTVSEILEEYNVEKTVITEMIQGGETTPSFLSQLINGAIDVDQLDYLLRDSYYTGVAYGMFDLERLLQTLEIYNGEIAVSRKGVGVIENILMARALMYSSVYFHKTVRIAELMLSKTIELTEDITPIDFFKMTDAEFITSLREKGDFQREIVTRLKYRNLFKQAYMLPPYQLDEEKKETLIKLNNVDFRREKEREFEETLGIPRGYIIIDAPSNELHQSEPRLLRTNIPIIEQGEKKSLEEFTPVADAIRMRAIPDWIVMVICDEKQREKVSKHTEEILFN